MATDGPDDLEAARKALEELKAAAKPIEAELRKAREKLQPAVEEFNGLKEEQNEIAQRLQALKERQEQQAKLLSEAQVHHQAAQGALDANPNDLNAKQQLKDAENILIGVEKDSKEIDKEFQKVAKEAAGLKKEINKADLKCAELIAPCEAIEERLDPIKKAIVAQDAFIQASEERAQLAKERDELGGLSVRNQEQESKFQQLNQDIISKDSEIEQKKVAAESAMPKAKEAAEEPGEGWGGYFKRRGTEILDVMKSKNSRDPRSPLEHGGMLVDEKAQKKYGMKTGATDIAELIEELIENLIKALTVLPQRIYAFYAQKAQPEISMERDPSSAPSPEPSVSASKGDDEPSVTASRGNDSQADLLARLEATGNTADREASLTLRAAGEDKSQEEASHTFTPAADRAAANAEQQLKEQRQEQSNAREDKPDKPARSPSMRMGRGGGGSGD